jgi:hypothetical protein
MALTDNTAYSVGSFGTTLVFSTEGRASVLSSVPNENEYLARPINDKLTNFEKANTVRQSEINRICYYPASVMADNYMDSQKLRLTIDENEAYKATVADGTIDTSIVNFSTMVIDPADTNKYIINYLTLRQESIKNTAVGICDSSQSSLVYSNENTAISRTTVVEKIMSNVFVDKTAVVSESPSGKTIFSTPYVYVENYITPLNSQTKIVSATVNVEDYKPPTGASAGSAGGLNSFRIVCQKYAYFEHTLNFMDSVVTSITGLPQGVIYELGSLKGSPSVSGDYPITIKLANKTALSGLMTVTQVPRQL